MHLWQLWHCHESQQIRVSADRSGTYGMPDLTVSLKVSLALMAVPAIVEQGWNIWHLWHCPKCRTDPGTAGTYGNATTATDRTYIWQLWHYQ